MVLDLVVCGLLLFFALLGAFSGALAQLARVAAVIACAMFGRPLGALLSPAIAGSTSIPPLLATLLASTAAFFGLYLGLTLLLRALIRRLTEDREIRALDRGAGAFLGAAKAGAIAWLLLSALVFLDGKGGGNLRFDPRGSFFAELARDANFFTVGLPLAPALPKPGLQSALPVAPGPSGAGPGTIAPKGGRK